MAQTPTIRGIAQASSRVASATAADATSREQADAATDGEGGGLLPTLLVGRGAPAPSGACLDREATTCWQSGDGRPPGECADSWWWSEARRLFPAERDRTSVDLLSRRRPGVSVEDAYRVQWCGTELRVRGGARVVGHRWG